MTKTPRRQSLVPAAVASALAFAVLSLSGASGAFGQPTPTPAAGKPANPKAPAPKPADAKAAPAKPAPTKAAVKPSAAKADAGKPAAPVAAKPVAPAPTPAKPVPPPPPAAPKPSAPVAIAPPPPPAPALVGKPPGPALPPPPPAAAPVTTPLPGETEFNSCKKFPANKRIVKLNMKPETELGDLIGWISAITCRQFLLPGTIPANSKKVTIISPQLITPEEAYRLFLAAIESVGLTVEPSGKFLRIVETNKAKQTSIPVYGYDSTSMPSNESYVTRLVRMQFVDVTEVSNVLGRLKSTDGDIVPYPPQGTLIITDKASNVERMLGIIEEIDIPGDNEKVWMLRMKNSAATEMAQKLAEIFSVQVVGGKRGAGGAPAPSAPAAPKSGPGTQKKPPGDLASEMVITKIIPDERSNQLIVIANERAYARLLTMVRKLDVPIEGGDGRIHVYYCENANADELAQTLGAVTGVAVSGSARRTGTGTSARPATPTPSPTGTPGQTGQTAALLFEGEVRINYDLATNALIVLSGLKDFQALRRVIERLDAPRKQVFIEAMIMEVSLDKTRDLGAAYHGGIPYSIDGKQSVFLGGFNAQKTLNPAGLLTDSTALLGLGASVLGPPLAGAQELLGISGAVTVPSFGVFIQLLQRNNDVNVLSNPHLLITNNEDGEISVGQNLPFPGAFLGGGSLGGAGGIGGLLPQVSVQRQDVALKLKLTPHVNEHNMIRLDVDQEISDIVSANYNGLGPATSKRTAKTKVVARDQQTIVIGGLMSDRTTDRVTKIPILGDIPIIGFFFRNTTKTIQKTNILIALTPYVVTDQSDLRRVLEKKLRERREFVERFSGTEDRRDSDAARDYTHGRGMLEEINRAARDIEGEEDAMRVIRARDAEEEKGPIEPAGIGGSSDKPKAAPRTAPPAPEERS